MGWFKHEECEYKEKKENIDRRDIWEESASHLNEDGNSLIMLEGFWGINHGDAWSPPKL